jgi:hypothetical protein
MPANVSMPLTANPTAETTSSAPASPPPFSDFSEVGTLTIQEEIQPREIEIVDTYLTRLVEPNGEIIDFSPSSASIIHNLQAQFDAAEVVEFTRTRQDQIGNAFRAFTKKRDRPSYFALIDCLQSINLKTAVEHRPTILI